MKRLDLAFGLSLAAGLLLGVAGCDNDQAGCSTDSDCRGSRVCSNGICLESPGGDTGPDGTTPDTGTPSDTFDPGDTSTPPDTGADSSSDTGTDGFADTADTSTPDPDVISPDAGMRGPQIKVVPSGELDFGTITVPTSTNETLTVRNVGDATLSLKSSGIVQTPSQGFSVASGPNLPKNLAPGKQVQFTLTFDPNQQGRYENGFFIESNDRDPGDRRIEIDLEGAAFNKVTQPCLFSTPDTLDYGVVMPGNTATETVTIGNCSVSSQVTVTAYNFLSNPNGVFSVASSSPQPPFTVQVNQTRQIDIKFTPQSKRSLTGQLSIRSDETTGGGDYVDLVASGGGCAEADARARVPGEQYDLVRDGPIPVKPSKSVELDGTESTSPSGKLNYKWNIRNKPSGSSATLSSTTASNPTLNPQTPGVYTVELNVTNPVSGKQGCVTDTIEIVALPNQPALQVTTPWQADHNMDLHVVRSNSNGNFPNFRDQNNDVYPEQPAQNWGQSGKRTDDAFHLGDANEGSNTSSQAGERVLVAEMEKSRDYRIALHFRDADGFRPARFGSDAEVTVNGQTQSLSHRWTIRDRNKFWISFEVDGATGNVTTVDMER